MRWTWLERGQVGIALRHLLTMVVNGECDFFFGLQFVVKYQYHLGDVVITHPTLPVSKQSGRPSVALLLSWCISIMRMY